ncbi:hypothetical protein KY285_013466 [Solanum tuberosum]|nr:hypothetical protein KY285_013466 [Solanum tuberosum]
MALNSKLETTMYPKSEMAMYLKLEMAEMAMNPKLKIWLAFKWWLLQFGKTPSHGLPIEGRTMPLRPSFYFPSAVALHSDL